MEYPSQSSHQYEKKSYWFYCDINLKAKLLIENLILR